MYKRLTQITALWLGLMLCITGTAIAADNFSVDKAYHSVQFSLYNSKDTSAARYNSGYETIVMFELIATCLLPLILWAVKLLSSDFQTFSAKRAFLPPVIVLPLAYLLAIACLTGVENLSGEYYSFDLFTDSEIISFVIVQLVIAFALTITALDTRRYMRRVLVGFSAILAAVFLVAFMRAYHTNWQRAHPLSDPTVGFQMYEPTVLPKDLAIQETSIFVRGKNPGGLTSAMVSMLLNADRGRIGQSRTSSDQTATHTGLSDYDPLSIDPTCLQRTSPSKVIYRLCHWIEFDHISVFEPIFVKGDTLIWSNLPTTIDNPLTFEEIDTFVDSFVPGSPEGLDVSTNAV